jgi:arylsulfatase A-like enzyme
LEYFNMMLEALDVEIERLLASLPDDVRDNTYVIFMGDNGSGRQTVRPPVLATGAKGTMYQGGINVPLFVTGPGVAKGTSKALVNSSDMFLTILEMAGIDADETVPERTRLDSVSFMPYLANPDAESIRSYVYADEFEGNFSGIANAEYAIRNAEFKLLYDGSDTRFFNLLQDPYEKKNLLDGKLSEREQEQYDELDKLVTELRAGN